jgi:hypothetical protein
VNLHLALVRQLGESDECTGLMNNKIFFGNALAYTSSTGEIGKNHEQMMKSGTCRT